MTTESAFTIRIDAIRFMRVFFLMTLTCQFFVPSLVYNQSLLSAVISTTGGSLRGQNIALYFNAGDLTVGALQGQTVRLTQGFVPGTERVATDIHDDAIVPKALALHQNFPNPFNPSTTITFDLPHTADVSMTIYNSLGMSVGTIRKGMLPAGSHTVQFDGKTLASGVYFYRLQVDGAIRAMKKMMIIK